MRSLQKVQAGVNVNWDMALVRHIYDLYCIAKHRPQTLA